MPMDWPIFREATMLEFQIRIEGRPDRAIRVESKLLVAGSENGLDIVLPGGAARHFEISVRPVGVVLRNLDPDRETRVNGNGVTQVRLSVGDVIEVGAARVIFSRHGAASPPVAAKPAPGHAAPPAPPTPPPGPRPARRRSSSLGPVVLLVLLALLAGAAIFLLNRDDGSSLPISLLPPDDPATGAGAGEARFQEGPDGSAGDAPRNPWLEPTAALDPEPMPEPEPGATATPADEPPPPALPAAIPDHEAVERRERQRREEMAREKLRMFMEILPDRIARYTFDGPIGDLTDILDTLPEGALRDDVEARLDDLNGAQRTFDRMRASLSDGTETRVTLESGLKLIVVGADDVGFDARVGPATTRKKWTELQPLTSHSVAAKGRPSISQWLDAAAFAALFREQETAEDDLRRAFLLDEAYLADISAALARYRDVDLPAGGFVLHEDLLVTQKEKGYLEQGLVRYDGKWMTKDEALAAQGYVRHEGRWLSPRDYERVLEEIAEAEALAKKYLPKGYIDQPGHGSDVPWKQKIEIKTRHYKIQTNLDRDTAKDIAYTMEVLRMNLASVFGLRGKGARFTVNVVANRDQYRATWRAAGGSLGFCSGSMICTFYQPPMTTSVLMHEGTHQMLRRFAPSCPRWMHEGMATYFECSKFEFDPKRKRVNLKVGLLNAMRLSSFQREHNAGRTVPLETFLKGGGGNPYTEGWAFVYYLAKGRDGQYARKLHTFVGEAHQADVIERFQKIFKVRDLKVFEKEWLEFILGLNPADGVRLAGQHR